MNVKIAAVAVVSTLLTGCVMSSSRTSEPTKPSPKAAPAAASPATRTSAVALPATRPVVAAAPATQLDAAALPPEDEALSPRFAPPPPATAAHLQEIEPAILELARRAQAGDRAYFVPKMGQPGEHLVEAMMEKVQVSDLPNTFRTHLIGDRLNYHEKTHVQVELAQKDGKWEVSRLWFCR